MTIGARIGRTPFRASLAKKRVVQVFILGWKRPALLERTLTALFATRHVELRTALYLNTDTCADVARRHPLDVVTVARENTGITFAWNELYRTYVDPAASYLCLLQDDLVLDPEWAAHAIYALEAYDDIALVNCHHSPDHPKLRTRDGLDDVHHVIVKPTVGGAHMIARPSFWQRVMPIVAKHHNDEDWWIVRDAPDTPIGRGAFCGVIPGMAEHVGWNQSTWMTPGSVTREYADPYKEILR